jgi:Ni/Co efflux regulator RcnB
MKLTKTTLAACVITGLFAAAPVFAQQMDHGHDQRDQYGPSHDNNHAAPQHQSGPQRTPSRHEPEHHAPKPKPHPAPHHTTRHAPPHKTSGHDYFNSNQRSYLQSYYHTQFHGHACPPGLIVRDGYCVATGPRRWRVGAPLTGITYYALPADVQVRLGQPPTGYHYVRVGTDILMVALTTGIVVDAVTNLSGM